MFGKVNPAPAVSKCVRMVFRSLLAPLELIKTIKNNQKHDINENPGFFGFLTPLDPMIGGRHAMLVVTGSETTKLCKMRRG